MELTNNKSKDNEITIYQEKVDDMFKVSISEDALAKIKFLCKRVPARTEWSGILFYKVEGEGVSCINNNVVTIVDIVALNIGNSTFTKYESDDPRYLDYLFSHPELTEPGVYRGHIHSHHEMATFFSGTDTAELIESAEYFNIFVSLIVNNAGNYSIGYSTVVKTKETSSTNNKLTDWDSSEVVKDSASKEDYDMIIYNHGPIIPANVYTPGDDFVKNVDALVTEHSAKTPEVIQQELFATNMPIGNQVIKSDTAHTFNGTSLDLDLDNEKVLKVSVCRLISCSLYGLTESLSSAAWAIPTGISIDEYVDDVESISDLIMTQLGSPVEPEEIAKIYEYWIQEIGEYKGTKKEYLAAVYNLLTGWTNKLGNNDDGE